MSASTDEQARLAEVNRIVESYGPILYGSSAGGFENGFLIFEATRRYRLGADLACILCSHACCERELAVILQWQQPATPNAERWGLGRLIRTGRERDWFDADLASKLEQVNENRRRLYHLQDFNAPTSLWRRAIRTADNPVTKDDVAAAIPGTLRQDALDALDCAFAVRTVNGVRKDVERGPVGVIGTHRTSQISQALREGRRSCGRGTTWRQTRHRARQAMPLPGSMPRREAACLDSSSRKTCSLCATG